MEQAVTEAVRILREGGVILYPTDTVWGIGCDATNAEAVERIYHLKRSENKKSMLVLCATPDMVVRYVHKAPGIAFEVQELATKPLTLILPGASGVAANLIPEEGTLGVRIPDHAFCQAMLRKLGRPIVSTSANISGEDTPRNLAEISREIIDGVDYVVNPKFEGKPTGKASSILLSTKPESSGSSANKAPTELRPLFTIYQAESLSGSPPKAATGSCPKRYTLWHESSKLLFKSVFRISTCSST